MSNDAEVNMLLYGGLLAQEESILKAIENDVVKSMIENGITARALWTSGKDAGNRFIQLCIPGDPKPIILLEMTKF